MKSKHFSSLLLFIFFKLLEAAPKPKVVIVGAGPAGLAAGTKLLEFGFKDFRILEAEPRVGGRIHTIPFADNVIDLGAQWCHGEKNNVVYEMVHELNVLESSASTLMQLQLARSNGDQIEKSIQTSLQEIVDTLDEHSEDYDNEKLSSFDFFKTEFFNMLEKSEYEYIDKTIAEEFLENFLKGMSCYESANNTAELPVRDEPDYETCEGDLLLNWKDKGYKQFLNILLKTETTAENFGILNNHIELSKKVTHIEWQRDDLKAQILCEDGEEILADHVIVTVSLGVLKAQHSKLFSPVLPLQKQKAIENIDFGTVNKIFIEFEQPFWPENWNGFQLLWRNEDLQEIRITKKAWLEGLHSFHVVAYQPRLLEGWMVGTFGRQMETLPGEVVEKDIVALLQRTLPWNVTNVLNFTMTNWFSNPNFRGTYSYHSMNMLESGSKPYDLELPLKVEASSCESNHKNGCDRLIILFAGEATNTKHYSTVQGAVESGWREAKRLADFYGVVSSA